MEAQEPKRFNFIELVKNYGVSFVGMAGMGFFVFVAVLRPFGGSGKEVERPAPVRQAAVIKTIAPKQEVPLPELDAEAYVVRIIGQKTPILQHRELKHLAPASITKLMTALIASEEFAPNDRIPFSQDAKNIEEKISASLAGDTFSRDDMLRFALVESDNDAALALAEAVGRKRGANAYAGAIDSFIFLMNLKAQVIGMRDSHFSNPTGLDQESHYMSADDIAKLAEYVWNQRKELLPISRTIEATVVSDSEKSYEIANTNELLKEFPGILASKTGFTDNARETLVMIYPVKPDHTAIVVILGSRDRQTDGKKLLQWVETAFQ